MNFSSLFGVLLGFAVLGGSIHESGMAFGYFLNFHGVVIVCGGTLAAAAISFPLFKILQLVKVFFLRVLGINKPDYQGTIEQFLEMNKKATLGLSAMNEAVAGLKNEFMKEALSLVGNGILNEKEIRYALEQRIKTTEATYMAEANMFKTIGKYPPAFGLLATTMGMISLLQRLGEPGAEKLIGPAMSIGLVGTLYGISIANMIFLPIADNLIERSKDEIQLRRLILEGSLLIKQHTNPIALRESLNSFLLPKDRVTRKAA